VKTAVYGGSGQLLMEDRPEPELQADDDVILTVEACGICGSDMQALSEPPAQSGEVGMVMGHEIVGRVKAVGPAAKGFTIGQRVTLNPDPKCGQCSACATGKPVFCEKDVAIGATWDGAFASTVRVPVWSLHPIGDRLPAPLAALAEPLACVISGLNRVSLDGVESAVIIGGGTTGCLFTALLKAANVERVLVVDRGETRGKTAGVMGADSVLTPQAFAERREELVGAGADLVIDTTGKSVSLALEAARNGGCVLLFGLNQLGAANVRQVEMTFKNLAVIGHAAFLFNPDFPAAISLLEGETIDFSPLISTVPLSDISQGIAKLRAGEATKVVVIP
jgi:threonine dehydrogenase-like Zn-dependent dehydrogenase